MPDPEALKLLRSILADSVTEVYDQIEALISEAQNVAPETASRLVEAHGLLFSVRVELEEEGRAR